MAALTDAEIQTVLDAWPADDAGLPGSVQTALDSWTGQTMGPINAALPKLMYNWLLVHYNRAGPGPVS